ncbi:MAG: 2-dehydro-3-deoxy-6-phosphogalactonate aldolase [Acetobacteraceae bacterium]
MILAATLATHPLIAILRGITPEEAPAIGDALLEAGVRILEVPLNSPRPFESIAILARRCGASALVGAGTVMSAEEAAQVAEAGGRLAISPHLDAAVLAAAKAAGLAAIPGAFTASEIFAALGAGADAVKLFPAELIGPEGLRALRAVVPPGVALIPVGGVSAATMPAWRAAGASGFGVGSALYRPGRTAAEVAALAREIVTASR